MSIDTKTPIRIYLDKYNSFSRRNQFTAYQFEKMQEEEFDTFAELLEYARQFVLNLPDSDNVRVFLNGHEPINTDLILHDIFDDDELILKILVPEPN